MKFPVQTNEAYLTWLQDNGATSGAVQDAEHEMLASQGATGTQLDDMYMEVLGSLGYTGSLNDRKAAFWADGATFGSTWSPLALFASSEQGVWYDPSDLSSMFQDSAGTTPVTAVEQPVGKILDKSGNGNHATQATTSYRPILRARYNKCLYSQDLSDVSGWFKTATVSSPTHAAPDGTNTANKVTTTAAQYVAALGVLYSASDTPLTWSIYAKAAEYSKFVMLFQVNGGFRIEFDLSAGTASVVDGSASGCTYAITSAGNGWYRCSVSVTGTYASQNNRIYPYPYGTASWDGSGIYLWGGQLEASPTLGTYQWINAADDYDADPDLFPYYLDFDGVDDSLVTAAIDFSATDKVSVFAGITKLSDSAGMIAELSVNAGTNNGAFYLLAGVDVSSDYSLYGRGTVGGSGVTAKITGFPAVDTCVLTGLGSISGDLNQIRRNGVSGVDAITDQGTGNYSTFPLYIGRRGGTSLPLNGNLYPLIVRGAPTAGTDLTDTEAWVANKTGVTL